MLRKFVGSLIVLYCFSNGFSAVAEGPIQHLHNLAGIKLYNGKEEKKFERTEGISKPFMTYFKGSKTELCYTAVRHANSVSSPTFQLVKNTFDSFDPEILILEGFYYECGRSPSFILSSIKQEEGQKHWQGGEVSFAASLAHKKGIPFVGAEPTDKAILSQLTSKGYTDRDFVFFYFLRNIPQYGRSKELSAEDQLPMLFDRDMERWDGHHILQSIPTYGDYQDWFHRHYPEKLSFKKLIDHDLTCPQADSELFFHQLSNEIELIRDTHILKVQLDLSREFSKIMTVYGGSHYRCQEEVLKRYFGTPLYLRGTPSRRFFGKKAPTAKEFFRTYKTSKISLV